jgi:pimeloyl-ACP methyl ester carboxylesterase
MSGYESLTSPPPQDRFEVRSADGTGLNVEIYGPQRAPTVILVHGWTCSIAFWTRQINAMLAEGLRVVAYDQRGHGASAEPGPSGYTIEALADDLAAVLNATLAPEQKAVLAGHSMGAMTLVAFAARHPEQLRARVAAAVIASTGMHELVPRSKIFPMPLPLAKLARPMSTWLIGLSPVGTSITPLVRATMRYTALSRSATEVDVEFCAWIVNSCPPRTRARFGRMISDLDLDRQVARLDVPTVVVAGVRDRLTPIWHARRLAAQLPRLVDLVEVADAGHMTPVQSAAQVNAALLQLIADHLDESVGTRVRPTRSGGSIGVIDLAGRRESARPDTSRPNRGRSAVDRHDTQETA